MSKKFRIITLVAAIVFGLGGIAFGVYGLSMLKTINSKVTYTPDPLLADLTVSYAYYSSNEAAAPTKKDGTGPVEVGRKSSLVLDGNIVLNGMDEFVVYEFKMDVNTDIIPSGGAYYKITVIIYDGATGTAENEDMEIFWSDAQNGFNSTQTKYDYENSNYNLKTGLKNNLTSAGEIGCSYLFENTTVYILIRGGEETEGGPKQVIFNVDFSKTTFIS